MTRLEWLKKRHADLKAQIDVLEKQRETDRSPEHKAMLQDLKKQKLAVKEEKYSLMYSWEIASEDASVN